MSGEVLGGGTDHEQKKESEISDGEKKDVDQEKKDTGKEKQDVDTQKKSKNKEKTGSENKENKETVPKKKVDASLEKTNNKVDKTIAKEEIINQQKKEADELKKHLTKEESKKPEEQVATQQERTSEPSAPKKPQPFSFNPFVSIGTMFGDIWGTAKKTTEQVDKVSGSSFWEKMANIGPLKWFGETIDKTVAPSQGTKIGSSMTSWIDDIPLIKFFNGGSKKG